MYVCTCLRMYLSVSMVETACGKFKQCASTESAVFYANINSPAFEHRRNFGCSLSSPRDYEQSKMHLRSQATSNQNRCKKNFNSFSPKHLRHKLMKTMMTQPAIAFVTTCHASFVNWSLFHSLKLMKTKLIHLQSSKKEA